MRALKIRIKDRHIIKYLENKIFLTQHFENMMIILINQDFNQNSGNNFKYLTNGRIMWAVFTDNSGGILKDQVDYIKNYYKNNALMNDIISVCKELKIHNIVEQIKNIKKKYKERKYGSILNNTFEDIKVPYFKLCNPIKLNAIAI